MDILSLEALSALVSLVLIPFMWRANAKLEKLAERLAVLAAKAERNEAEIQHLIETDAALKESHFDMGKKMAVIEDRQKGSA